MKKIFSILLASLALSSCVDTAILPDNSILDEDYWKKKTEVDAVVGAAYAQLRDETLLRNMIIWGDFRSDELKINSTLPTSAPLKIALEEIYSMNIQPENTFTTWTPFYSTINYCNLVLEKAEGVISQDPNFTRGDYETVRSQMLALRSWCYFYLVKVFHDVPVTKGAYLESSTDLNDFQKAPAEVLQMCINDLNEALKNAPANNAFAGSSNEWRDRGYFNRDGINALLCDIYLWRASVLHSEEDYRKAVEHADAVIKAKKDVHILKFGETEQEYYLSPADSYYDDVFVNGNAEESIIEVQMYINNTANKAVVQMYHNYTGSNKGYLKTTQNYAKYNGSADAKNIFKTDKDQRLYETVYDVTTDMEEYDVRKYTALTSNAELFKPNSYLRRNSNQNWILYRLTDVMLMKAEALVQLNDPEQAFEICKAVNLRGINNDATYALKYSTYQDKMEELVLQERARELAFEGKRWFDLMRYNYRHMTGVNYNSLLADQESHPANSEVFFSLALSKYSSEAAMKAKMPTEAYLYMPISDSEIKLNTNLKQNPVFQSKTK